MRVRAYLMTVFEARAETPMYGTAAMQDVATAWSNPSLLRIMLPPQLRPRFDQWVARFMAEQLDLFATY